MSTRAAIIFALAAMVIAVWFITTIFTRLEVMG